MLAAGQQDAAKQLLDEVPTDKQDEPEISAVRAALDLADDAADAVAQSAELEAAVAQNPKDHQARFDLALALYAQGNGEAAVDHLLTIVRSERKWNEEAARKKLIELFDAWGPKDPATLKGRRMLSALLFS